MKTMPIQFRHPPPTTRLAFSLVELLVVITIIAVLMALLLPALKAANDRAKTAACANNQRQLAFGFTGYLSDNNGYYPYAREPWGQSCNGLVVNGATVTSSCPNYQPHYGWLPCLAPYTGNTINGLPSGFKVSKLLQCPANPWPFSPYYQDPSSYVMNLDSFPVSFAAPLAACPDYCTNQPAIVTEVSVREFNKRINLSDIDHPSSLLLLGEVPVAPPFYQVTPTYQLPQQGLPMAWQGIYYYCPINTINGVVINPAAGWNWYGFLPTCNWDVSFFHNLGMNTVYPDGHVAWLSQKTVINYEWDAYNVSTNSNTAGVLFWFNHGQEFWFSRRLPGAPIN